MESSDNIPLFLSLVHAGFPSPADDYVDKALNLHELGIAHPATTYFVRVQGESMVKAEICERDLLVVDRAVDPVNGSSIVASLNGEFTVKRLRKMQGGVYLLPENPLFKPIKIIEEMDFQVFGVVTYIIHKTR
jgi:DNA polymerase V